MLSSKKYYSSLYSARLEMTRTARITVRVTTNRSHCKAHKNLIAAANPTGLLGRRGLRAGSRRRRRGTSTALGRLRSASGRSRRRSPFRLVSRARCSRVCAAAGRGRATQDIGGAATEEPYGDHAEDDPHGGDDNRNPGEKISGLGAEGTLPSHPAEGAGQPATLTPLDHHQQDQEQGNEKHHNH